MLSRLHRKAEALDSACLRAWGHPHNSAIRQELLVFLEWDSSLHPEHAHPTIRAIFRQVHDNSIALSNRIRSGDNTDSAGHVISHETQSLRQHLAALMHVLATRRGT